MKKQVDALEDYNKDGTGIDTANVNINSNTITLTNHGFVTGDFVTYRADSNGQPIGGLTDLQEYYMIKIDNDNFRVASTKYNAQRGFSVDLTSQGTGVDHKFSIINSKVYVLQCLNFAVFRLVHFRYIFYL